MFWFFIVPTHVAHCAVMTHWLLSGALGDYALCNDVLMYFVNQDLLKINMMYSWKDFLIEKMSINGQRSVSQVQQKNAF